MQNSNDNVPKNNSVINFYQPSLSVEEPDAHLKQGQKSLPAVASGSKPYMRMSKEGDGFYWGQENVPVEEGSRWAVNPHSYSTGYVAWNNGKKLPGEVMGPLASPPAKPDIDYSHLGVDWQEQVGIELCCIDGADEGQVVQYSASSVGFKKAFKATFEANVSRPNPDFMQPLVVLEITSYKNNKFNSVVYEPDFPIVDWVDSDGNFLSNNNVVAIEEEATKAEGMQTDPAQAAGGKQRKRRVNAA